MNDWSREHHGASGLTERCRQSSVTTREAEDQARWPAGATQPLAQDAGLSSACAGHRLCQPAGAAAAVADRRQLRAPGPGLPAPGVRATPLGRPMMGSVQGSGWGLPAACPAWRRCSATASWTSAPSQSCASGGTAATSGGGPDWLRCVRQAVQPIASPLRACRMRERGPSQHRAMADIRASLEELRCALEQGSCPAGRSQAPLTPGTLLQVVQGQSVPHERPGEGRRRLTAGHKPAELQLSSPASQPELKPLGVDPLPKW